MKAIIFDFNRTIYNAETDKIDSETLDLIKSLKGKGIKLGLISKNGKDRLVKIKQYNLDSLFHPVLKKINTIVLEYDFCEIKNSDVIFPSIIDIYKKVIINILNNNNSYKNFYINVEKCCIIKNDQSKYNLIYDDILDNPDDNLIIYANINIDDKSELFGNITISTNYSNKDVFLKNSLLFIIEASTN